MNSITADLTLGFTDDNGRVTFYAKQYDSDTRKVHIIFEDDETAYQIANDVTHIFLKEQFADKSLLTPYQIKNPVWADERREMTFTLTSDMLRVPGVAKCELVFLHCTSSPIFNEDGTLESSDAIVLTTQSFNIYIEPSVSYGGSMSAAQQNMYDNMIDAIIAAQRLPDYDKYVLKTDIASPDTVGVIKVGDGLIVDDNGRLNVTGGGGGGGGSDYIAWDHVTGKPSDLVQDPIYHHTDNNYDNTAKSIVDNVTNNLYNKVDKVAGKGLSTNDYTTAEKNKLAGLENYTLPVATASVLGGVKIGTGINVDANGVISVGAASSVDWSDIQNIPDDLVHDPDYVHYVLPMATAETLGGIRIGTGLNIDHNGIVTVDTSGATVSWNNIADKPVDLVQDPVYQHTDNNYDNVAATVVNGLKSDYNNGKRLSTNDYTTAEKNKLASLNNYTLPAATASTLGGVKIGTGLTVLPDGTLSANINGVLSEHSNGITTDGYGKLKLEFASKSSYGAVKIGDGINVTDGVISAQDLQVDPSSVGGISISSGKLKATAASTSSYGMMKIGTGLEIGDNGELNVIPSALTDVDWSSLVNVPDDLVYDEDYVHTDENFTLAEKNKLATMHEIVYWEDIPNKPETFYTLPIASDSTLGGVKVGGGLTIDANGVLSLSGGLSFKIVDSVSDIDTTAPDADKYIYLVAKEGSESDIYDEYIVVEGEVEHIGDTTIDLSNIYTKDEVNSITGDLNTLETSDNSDLVSAINEVHTMATDFVFNDLEEMNAAILSGHVPEGASCYVLDDFIDASSTYY